MKMKKWIAVVLAVVCVAALFAGCAKKGDNKGGNTADYTSVKTLAEALALAEGAEDRTSGMSDTLYALVFQKDGEFWRFYADMTEEQSEAIFDLDMTADDYDEKLSAIAAEMPIAKAENITALRLSDDQMKALVGKTGEELVSDGWTSGFGYNVEALEFFLEYGPFTYKVTFETPDEPIAYDEETFDELEAIKPLVVKSVEYSTIGTSATDPYPDAADADVK